MNGRMRMCHLESRHSSASATTLQGELHLHLWPPVAVLRSTPMAAFFALHGAEGWCTRWWAATAIVVVLVAGTSFWLFFPPLCKDGVEGKFLAEWAAVAAFFLDAGRKINGIGRSTD